MQADDPQPSSGDRRNITVLFTASILIGLGAAVYEVALPLFLKSAGLDWKTMGWIYGAGAAVTFVIRWGVGAWSDRVGRKIVYVGSLIATGAATLITPFFAGALAQGVLKSITDPTTRLREAMHSVLLYESWPKRFQSIFSKTRGVEFLFHFFGLLLAAALFGVMVRHGMGGSAHKIFIIAAALVLLLAGVVFAAGFRERPMARAAKPALTWRSFVRMHLTRPMWVMTISALIFQMAITISHCFALQLFFQEKYGATDTDIFTIGALHRLAASLTLIFLGHVFRKRLKMWLIIFVVVEGIILTLPGFMPNQPSYHFMGLVLPTLWTAVIIWLGHDFFGMSLWMPIQQTLMQRYSRPDARGEDMTLATAIGALGSVPAPFLAGWLRSFPGIPSDSALNLPFIVSGVGVALSAVVLLWLPRDQK